MIERYTIKFGPAVSQKELEKILHTGEANIDPAELHKMKARIEFIGGLRGLKEGSRVFGEVVRELSL